MTKYANLHDHFGRLTGNRTDMSFSEIEKILGFTLPTSARKYNAWWANEHDGSHTHARAWQDAGWKSSQLNLAGEKVSFFKSNEVKGVASSPLLNQDTVASLGASAFEDLNEIKLEFSWLSAGNVDVDHKGRLRFPRLEIGPSVYRIEIITGQSSMVYIGETDNFPRRMQNYRTPGLSQQTNKRLNALMHQRLLAGGIVSISVTSSCTIEHATESTSLDFEDKFSRMLVESAAITIERQNGRDILNL